ncbi:DNA polymerase beta domain protein region [Hydrogenobaculum sp. Y04AAS1]|jgi:predicted nucleotidyltransferase|uniref:nucleotidyltransferase domain-containing protein n=1 Tax=Hydrogenobaculum sp. (strain Y04AAS1) TaxID=380749 RepID=UPI00015BCDF1|nr:DNA polymerase beta domain protein region [Hydrogenobaculum sp. Y04AAS1]HCT65930.1 DNA polymerase subunit beta [Hydrogenobaculum sp.]
MQAIKEQNLKEQVFEFLQTHKDELYEKFGVSHAGFFGSVAKGKEKENSDIDIYVEIEYSRIDLDAYLELIEYLEKAFKRKVDIITSNQLKHMRNHYKQNIIKNEIIHVF